MIEMLNNMADKWFVWQLSMLWQVAVLIGIVWVFDLLIRRWAWPQLRYALWLLILLKLVLPPTLTSPMSFTSEIPFVAQKAVKIQLNHPEAPKVNKPAQSVVITTTEVVPTDVITGSAEIVPSVEFSLKAYALFVWLSGVVLLSAWLIIRLTCLRSKHLKSERQVNPPDRFKELLAEAAKKLKLKKTPRVILTNKVCCPAVFGIFTPVLLVPADKLKNLTRQNAEHILLHELAHIKRRDLLIHAIYMTLQVVYWFNPLLWLIRRQFQNLRELCCDATVARLLKEKTVNYRETLLETARQLLGKPVAPGLGLLGLFENSNWLVERLRWLEKKTWKNKALRIATTVLLVCVMFSCVLPMAMADNQEEVVVGELADDEIILGPDEEAYIASLNLTSVDVIRDVRTLFQSPERITSKQTEDIIGKLMTDRRPEAKRAAADLLASENGWTRTLVIRSLPVAGDETEYFLTMVVEFWDNLNQKDKRQLQRSLPIVLKSNKSNAAIEELTDEIVALMISDSGKTVPLAGIKLVKKMDLESDRIAVALEGQIENPIYDYLSNEHPVRKAVLELLGEEYVPPQREQVDYSQISVAEAMQLERSSGLTVGVLTSLYTATGPCISDGDIYGWYSQCYLFPELAIKKINTYAYYHPITTVEESSLGHKLWSSGLAKTPILNSACSYDLSMCDVVVLRGVYNLRPEVVDALEDFVWNGGAIITMDGAGVVSCSASRKFAALQDMRNLDWSWKRVGDQILVPAVETSLTEDIDLSLPVDIPGRTYNKNGYRFNSSKYDAQVLLYFEPDEAVALRVSTYGSGRIAHFGWRPQFGSDEIGQRNWELFHRVLLWSAGHDYEDLLPEPAYSKERYQETKGIFGRIVDALK